MQAEDIYNSVRDTVQDQYQAAVPYAERVGKVISDDVAPSLKDAFKSSLNAVFTGVPKVITQV